MGFGSYAPYLEAGAGLLASYMAAKKSKQAANQASQGARLQDLLPLILPSLQAGQQAAGQNYALQQQRYAAALPLQQSVMRMTMGLMPNSYTTPQGGGTSGPLPPALNPLGSLSGPTSAGSVQPSDLLSSYQLRGGGTGGAGSGAMKGMSYGSVGGPIGMGVGAIIGAGVGAAHKHAQTAPTDLSVADASDAIAHAIRVYQQREPNAGEVQSLLQGQGLKPGDHWVGQGGLLAVLRGIQQRGGG